MPPAMDTLLGWLLIVLVLVAAYPWAAWLTSRSQREGGFWLPVLLALALCSGALSLIMFWQGLANIPFSLWGITLPYLLLMLLGAWLWRRAGMPRPALTLPAARWERIALALLLPICAGVLFNSLYWPFSREDALGIYARYGEVMFDQHALVDLPGEFTVYEAYPILIPLTYTYTYLASGWQNEFLARLFPALMSLGCLAAIFTLGRMLRGPLAGWVGALLLAITPAFGSWASSGYVDLPMAFFYTLAAIFAWRQWQGGHWTDALLAGAMMGLAAWTKNTGLIGIGLLAAWLLWVRLHGRITWPQIALVLLACGLLAAPWYLRNLAGAGLLIPPTIWTEQASRTLDTLLTPITHPQTYSITGPIVLVSVVMALVELVRRRLNLPSFALLLLWTLPFYVVWWWYASYDPRFILLFLPLWCVLAGVQLARVWAALPARWHRWLIVPVLVLVTGLVLLATWDSVENKDDLLRNPLMSVEERRMVAIRERQPELYQRLYGDEAP